MLGNRLRVFWSSQCVCQSKRFVNSVIDTHWNATPKPVDPQFLSEVLDVDVKQVTRMIRCEYRWSNVAREDIKESLALYRKHGILTEDLNTLGRLFELNPLLLEHRILVLQEAGIRRVDLRMLHKFPDMFTTPVAYFKERGMMPPDANVAQNFLSYLEKMPDDAKLAEPTSDLDCLRKIHSICMKHYLKWKFGLKDEDTEHLFRPVHMITYRSYRLLRQTIDLIEKELGMSKQKIMEYRSILGAHPENIRRLMTDVKWIGNTKMETLLRHRPKLLSVPVKSLVQKLEFLREQGVSPDDISRCSLLLLLSLKTIIERFKEFESIPELRIYATSPRRLTLIYQLHSVKRRLKVLQDRDIKSFSLHLLVATKSEFERHLSEGSDRTRGKDVLRYTSTELGVDYAELGPILRRHRLWCQVPLAYIDETLNYLRNRNYSNVEIYDNVHILLYTRKDIQSILEDIEAKKMYPDYDWTPSQRLALCLYHIERELHFSGCKAYNYMEQSSEMELEKLSGIAS